MEAEDERNTIHAELARSGIRHDGIGIDEDGITVSIFLDRDVDKVEIVLEYLGYVPAPAFKCVVSGRWTVRADRVPDHIRAE